MNNCQYEFKKGPRKGEKCGVRSKNQYCYRHREKANSPVEKPPVEKPSSPVEESSVEPIDLEEPVGPSTTPPLEMINLNPPKSLANPQLGTMPQGDYEVVDP